MEIQFFKYHGTGNDFILIDDRDEANPIQYDQAFVQQLCHRRFGIGADGLIRLCAHTAYDFEMIYYNADGAPGSMCGNGGRCIAAFAKSLGIYEDSCSFLASDGMHQAHIVNNEIALRMQDVEPITETNKAYAVLDTGSPHYVTFVKNLAEIDVAKTGASIRYSEPYLEQGINVNFVQRQAEGGLQVATYERGVEAETYSCGTGVTAAAIASVDHSIAGSHRIPISTKGGQLAVSFDVQADASITDIYLIGPAEFVFAGIFFAPEQSKG